MEDKTLPPQYTWQVALKVEMHFVRNVFILQLNSKWRSERRNKDASAEMFASGAKIKLQLSQQKEDYTCKLKIWVWFLALQLNNAITLKK